MSDLNPDGSRPFSEFRASGLLWLINAGLLHARGFALAFVWDDDADCETDAPTGWTILGDGTEPWVMGDGMGDVPFAAVEALLDSCRPRPLIP